ncbi:hypothetical protein BT93_L4809 [Corymbia citriodora subsp. variegata]|uniref:CFEM domain-containing protein n=1 Tax=Corymbia citriodora subsp. variegata TaxID=360336 RepID=A0A8T0CGH4_CORYI|nr:hypothetical protein BT93_L4809 [Corymbia citriodora subsp. variegata]
MKSIILFTAIAATITAQTLDSAPQCVQQCFSSITSDPIATQLGCKPKDATCLVWTPGFAPAIQDCILRICSAKDSQYWYSYMTTYNKYYTNTSYVPPSATGVLYTSSFTDTISWASLNGTSGTIQQTLPFVLTLPSSAATSNTGTTLITSAVAGAANTANTQTTGASGNIGTGAVVIGSSAAATNQPQTTATITATAAVTSFLPISSSAGDAGVTTTKSSPMLIGTINKAKNAAGGAGSVVSTGQSSSQSITASGPSSGFKRPYWKHPHGGW